MLLCINRSVREETKVVQTPLEDPVVCQLLHELLLSYGVPVPTRCHVSYVTARADGCT